MSGEGDFGIGDGVGGQRSVNPSVAYGDSSPYRGAKARIPEVSPNRGDFFVPSERGCPEGQGVIRRIKRCRNPSVGTADISPVRGDKDKRSEKFP